MREGGWMVIIEKRKWMGMSGREAIRDGEREEESFFASILIAFALINESMTWDSMLHSIYEISLSFPQQFLFALYPLGETWYLFGLSTFLLLPHSDINIGESIDDQEEDISIESKL